MTVDRLNELTAGFRSRRVAVVGDYFLDKYLDCDPDLTEVSLETGKTANQVVNVRCSPGAAGTVVSNLKALGAGEIVPVGFTGEDGEGHDLRKGLHGLAGNLSYLLSIPELHTPTYLKPRNCRVPSLNGEAERYDTKNRRPFPREGEEAVIDILDSLVPQVDAVIIADQVQEEDCGVITSRVRDALCALAAEHPQVVFWVDSRCRIGLFRSIVIKPNQEEAVRAAFPDHLGETDEETVVNAGRVLRTHSGRTVFLTRGERGILVFEEGGWHNVRGVQVEGPIDPTGAGDSATVAAVLTLVGGGTAVEAALVANLVASITIEQIGVTGTAKPEDLPSRLQLWRSQG